jgi:hypothetical protein
MGMGDSVTTICPVSNGTPHLLEDGKLTSLALTWVVNNSPALTSPKTTAFNREKATLNRSFLIYLVLWGHSGYQQSLLSALILKQHAQATPNSHTK